MENTNAIIEDAMNGNGASSMYEEDIDENWSSGDLKQLSPSRRLPHYRQSRSGFRKRYEEDHYVHTLSQSSMYTGRRLSDPGCRMSVSPIRHMHRPKIDSEIAEDEEDTSTHAHPRLAAVRSVSMSHAEEYPIFLERNMSPSRSRTRDRCGNMHLLYPQFMAKKRTQRSYSLPTSDPAILEIGEAIGAVAISKPAPQNTQQQETSSHAKSAGPMLRRRRSVSIESSNLEAIVEENAAFQAGRRFSTPMMNTT